MPDETNTTSETPSNEDVALTTEEQQFESFANELDGIDDEDLELDESMVEEPEPVEAKGEEEGAPAEEPSAGEPPKEPEAEAPEPEPEPEQAEEPKPEEPAPETQPEPVQQKPEVPETPAPSQEELAEQRKNLEADLARTMYAMTDEENDAMLLSPKDVMPKMAAKLHVEILNATVNGVLPHIPRIVQMQMKQAEQNADIQTRFYEKWGKLKGHEETVQRVAAMYAQLNPTADAEQTIKDIGVQAMLMLGLPLDEVTAVPETPAAAPAPAPAAAAISAPANPGGAAGMVPAPPKSTNPFTQLSEEFMVDEDN